ncbi:tetratricopeptide repeat protein [Flavobacterium sp. CS20]|uniref:tetratricopeptide repeat protein n=1 Tax=Flavobacterium sp. CS20 TaxID=2775246 RepID=UPI001B3A26F7|nr:tetratricopeptide repeat protein [Flavobacterium sp. CS20]QTY27712.1 tetratricopeptide repeat protein [Flavobacterium sp. CS20]
MKTTIFSLLLMCFVITTYAQKKEIRKAEDAVEDKAFDEAKSLLKQVENTYKEENEKWQSTYLLTKGKAYLANGIGSPFEDLKTATEAFQQAIELGKDVEEAQKGLDDVRATLVNSAVEDQEKQKDLIVADKLYKAYELGKQDTLYLYYAASSAVNGRDYDRALKYYKQLLDLNFDGSQVLYQATNVETGVVETFGNKTLRDASVKSGSHKDPKDINSPSKTGEIAKNISLIYIEQNKPEKAIEAMKRAKQENPDDVALMQAEADLYYNLGNIKKYNEIMSSIAEKNPNDPIVFYNLGVSAEKLEDFDKAKKMYQKAIELDPEMANAYNNIASIILAKDREITEEMNKLGMSPAETKKYDELKAEKIKVLKTAVPYLKKTIELDSTNINAMKYLKSIYYQTQENDKAEEIDKLIKEAESKQE